MFPRTLPAARTVALMAFALSPSMTMAATATGTMTVSATVLDTCLLVVPPLAFGNYDGDVIDAQADISLTCTGTTAWTVDIDEGGSMDISAREMSSVGDVLSYQLYTDAGRTTVFGDGVTGSTVTGTGSGVAQLVPVYGRVAAGQFPDTGAYTDTVTVTVSY